jgi:hypothetical protein
MKKQIKKIVDRSYVNREPKRIIKSGSDSKKKKTTKK